MTAPQKIVAIQARIAEQKAVMEDKHRALVQEMVRLQELRHEMELALTELDASR